MPCSRQRRMGFECQLRDHCAAITRVRSERPTLLGVTSRHKRVHAPDCRSFSLAVPGRHRAEWRLSINDLERQVGFIWGERWV